MRLCIITARAGSKGVPGKNVKLFAGQPLLAHSIQQAKVSGLFDIIAISSDSADYRQIAMDAGADLAIDRPAHLASDEIGKPPVLHHALKIAEEKTGKQASVICDLQPTSPLRRAEDIPGAVETLEATSSLINVVSVGEASASPYYTLVEADKSGHLHLSKERTERAVRRQDLPAVYELNGSIYAWRREGIVQELPALTERTGYWIMPPECCIDIDTSLDFDVAAFVAHRNFGWPETPLDTL